MSKKLERAVKVPVKQRSASFALPLDYRIAKDETVPLTKARAFDWLEMKAFEGERSVRDDHVQFLFDEWAAGRFMWQHIILAAVRLGQDVYRINGQHTCWMVVNIEDRAFPKDNEVRCITYEVESESQLRALYSTFDRNKVRSVGHVGKVLLMGGRAARDIPPSYLNKLLSGFRVFFSEDWRQRHLSIAELTGMIEQNHSELFNIVGRWYQLHADENLALRRSSVMGAVFATFEKNVKASDEFWSTIASGLNLEEKTDPRWQLRRYIETHGHSSINGGSAYVTQEQLYCICINLWNHWRRGEKIATVRMMDTRPKARA